MAKKKLKLAKPSRRFGAACIDAVIPVIAYIIMIASAPRQAHYSYHYGYDYGYGYEMSRGGSAAGIVIACLLLLAYVIVECVFFAKGASIGKKLLGLQVVSSFNGKPLGFWRMLYREAIVKQASKVFLLGYIWILVDDRHRGWHDKIMDTYVVDLKASALIGMQNAPAPAATAAPSAPDTAAQAMPAPAVKGAPVSVAPQPEPAPAEPIRPTIRLDADDALKAAEPAIAVDVEAEPAAAEVKADMSMKKAELLEVAAGLGVSVNARATKAEIIEAIEKASK